MKKMTAEEGDGEQNEQKEKTRTAPSKHPLVGAGVYDWRGADGSRTEAEIVAVFPSGNVEVGDIAVLQ